MNKKYELSDEFIKLDDKKLYRIRALQDGPWGKKGTLGGYVESEKNLNQCNDCWIYETAKVYGNAHILNNAKVYGNAQVCDKALVYDNAQVYGNAQVCDKALVYGNAQVYGYAIIFDDAFVYENAKIYDDAIIFDDVQIHGNAHIYGNTQIYKCVKINDNLFYGDVIIKYNYTKYPYYIKGSKHIVNYIGNRDNEPIIKIGCIEHTLNYWLENYKRIGINNNYTCEEIEEYKFHLLHIQTLINIKNYEY